VNHDVPTRPPNIAMCLFGACGINTLKSSRRLIIGSDKNTLESLGTDISSPCRKMKEYLCGFSAGERVRKEGLSLTLIFLLMRFISKFNLSAITEKE